MSAAGNVSPRLPLDGATEPHPDGLRIALGDGGIFYLYPPAPRTQAEAVAEAVRTRTLVAAAVVAAANTVAEAVETELGAAQTIDEWVAAEAAAMAAAVAAAGADALRAALEPPALSESEEACVQAVRAYLQGFTEAAYLEGAAAMREAEEKKPKTTRPQGPAAVGTYPELAVIDFAAADARTVANWSEAPGGGALVHTRKKAGLQVRFAPSVGGDRWADPLPGALSDDLFGILKANGGLDTVCLNQVVQDLAVRSEHEHVSLDDLGRLIGLDPRSTKDREAMRRDLWGRLKLLDGITVWGARKHTYRDPVTREKVPVVSRDALYLIGGTMWPDQGTLDDSAVPLEVSFVAGPLLAQFRGRPDVLESFGEYRRLAAIPRGKVSGAWAFAAGRALTQRWRELASYGKAQKLTRRYLLTQFPPAPTVDEVLARTEPARARRYFTGALAELKAAGVIAAYREPDPKTLPHAGWAPVWLAQTVEVTQPATMLEAGAEMQATREEAEEKAARGRKRRPKRAAPLPE